MQTSEARKPDHFPVEGLVRAKQAAKFLGIGVSTLWKYASKEYQQIKPPRKMGARISVWDAEYIRELKENGIPAPASKGGE